MLAIPLGVFGKKGEDAKNDFSVFGWESWVRF
jgi:hypothetical protein